MVFTVEWMKRNRLLNRDQVLVVGRSLTLPMTEGLSIIWYVSVLYARSKLEALELGLLTGQNGQRLCNSLIEISSCLVNVLHL
jgi:hypothetical protein